ncbi:hypothetical protein AB832_05800 [Flavobacteriaceae bacterium (ex Bugula neritina AB1)]|nr:hypothetical protein AB832_05800 [Flavobacteriaceae bacterium (ex Bugula neritina AB1)]
MKNKISFFIAVLSVFALESTLAQNGNNQEEVSIKDEEVFVSLSQIENKTVQSLTGNSTDGNSIFIEQIGIDNKVLYSGVGQSSTIHINQDGERNLVNIYDTAKEVEKNIVQLGNDNTVVDFSFHPDISTNLEIVQEGNQHYFERFGTNELSKNLKFKMTGNARTIIVRSF